MHIALFGVIARGDAWRRDPQTKPSDLPRLIDRMAMEARRACWAWDVANAGMAREADMAIVERVFSGVQPTGNLHLGNYLGASSTS